MVFLILRVLCQVPYPVERLLLNAGALRAKRCFSFMISSCLPLKFNLRGISNPPCGRSEEYLFPPITTQSTVLITKSNWIKTDVWNYYLSNLVPIILLFPTCAVLIQILWWHHPHLVLMSNNDVMLSRVHAHIQTFSTKNFQHIRHASTRIWQTFD